MFRILEREKQATAEGSGDVESSNEIPYELAQFEIHLRQPVKIHNIRKRMQQEQQASSSSENGKRYFYCTCACIKYRKHWKSYVSFQRADLGSAKTAKQKLKYATFEGGFFNFSVAKKKL